MTKCFALLGVLSVLLACDALFLKKCTYRESCRCGLSTRRVTVSTDGCSSLFGICQIDCPKGLFSLDLDSKLRHFGLNIIPKSLCSVFEECQECDSAGLRCASCPPFKYGPLCRHDCVCYNADSCDQSGRCICKEGYTGLKCREEISEENEASSYE